MTKTVCFVVAATISLLVKVPATYGFATTDRPSVPHSPDGAGSGGPPAGGARPAAVVPGTAAPGGLETFLERAWPILYAGDAEAKQAGVRDSSKNLRVLWTRALLASLGRIEDDVAYDFLPRKTRAVVGRAAAALVWGGPLGRPAVGKLDWIVERTNFIDRQLTEFVDVTASAARRQVVLLGAGYDTRALRFRSKAENVHFFEVDLPDISAAKEAMLGRYFRDRTETPDAARPRPKHIGFDLNEIASKGKHLFDALGAAGFNESLPSMVICEAVLFYLQPEAAQGLIRELFTLSGDKSDGKHNIVRYCFTDNLAKLGVAPGPPVPTPRDKCAEWLEGEGLTLVDHNAIWGGAIHFVAAE